ncbi:MAG TPA: flagellar hook protein FlgE [Deltaproteobacteria bacterium]|nr:flagellar hook protein FlgE [Deltaproteobacteria bacterium]
MGSSLYAGISGLTASSKQMDVIGNNIANVNTVGFRAGKIHFSDILSQSITGGSSTFMQVGRGVSISDVATQFSPGSFETTANATDLSIDGDGFFIVRDADGGSYYTRAGSFHVDSDGYLVDTNGLKVQGYNFQSNDPNTVTDLSLSNVQSAPVATTEISIGANLNSDTVAGENFNAAQTVYDSQGKTHTLKATFQKTEANGYWSVQTYLDNNEATSQTYCGLKFDSNGDLERVYNATATETVTTAGTGTATMTVNNQGQMYKDTGADIVLERGADENTWTIVNNGGYLNMSFTLGTVGTDDEVAIDLDGEGGADVTFALAGIWANGDTIEIAINQTELAPADVSLTFGPLSNGATIGNGNTIIWDLAGSTAQTITGYASTSVVKALTHDGYASGVLKSLSVTPAGILSGFFTNGQTADIGQLVLADFSNPWGLKRMGNNLFGETVTSGAAVLNTPGSAGMGDISPNSLEMSNTDIATEFINMITAQRAYQACAKIVTVTDEMMSTLMNVKR